jgi:DNA repair exonuclease SbcCD ATPase subunit
MRMRINSLQIENVKRVKALRMEPSPQGLTVIGGKNAQGKTSVLDAIAWALGGSKRQPSNPQTEGSLNPPSIDIILDNGIRVQRKGKNSTLTVIDPSGGRAGQALLDEFVGQFALDLPRFLQASAKEKATALLDTLGIGAKLAQMETNEKRLYDERTAVGRIADSKAKHAQELPEYPDAPEEPVSMSELLKQQQDILAKNASNLAMRREIKGLEAEEARLRDRIAELQKQIDQAIESMEAVLNKLATARKTETELQDESTVEIELRLANIEAVNAQVASNQAKAAAADEAAEYQAQYDALTSSIDDLRTARLALLDGAKLPLDGLGVEEGELTYHGQKWDCMSGSEQLKVAVAIAKAIKPECGFVLMDKLEQMDLDTLKEFGAWLESQDLQVIATRVSTGEECTIVIEDGLPKGKSYADVVTGIETDTENKWKEF